MTKCPDVQLHKDVHRDMADSIAWNNGPHSGKLTEAGLDCDKQYVMGDGLFDPVPGSMDVPDLSRCPFVCFIYFKE